MKSNLGPRLKTAALYIVFNAIAYFGLPYAAAYIEISTGAAQGTLLTVVPLMSCCISIAVGYFYGKRASRDPIMPVVCALLVLICYGGSAWIYVPVAALASFIGQCLGTLYQKRG